MSWNNSHKGDEDTADNYYEESSESDYEQETENLTCKNLDPALAKLMGIMIEEQIETDWKPPLKSGLDNSKEIFSSIYLKNKHSITPFNIKNAESNVAFSLKNRDEVGDLNVKRCNEIDYFKVIKEDIVNYKTLTKEQLEYIKTMTNEEKFELIQIYNKNVDSTIESVHR